VPVLLAVFYMNHGIFSVLPILIHIEPNKYTPIPVKKIPTYTGILQSAIRPFWPSHAYGAGSGSKADIRIIYLI